MTNDLDIYIGELFAKCWWGDLRFGDIDKQKTELYVGLQNQINGFWSGSSLYQIMVDGGFLKDGSSHTPKTLTQLGENFMKQYEESL